MKKNTIILKDHDNKICGFIIDDKLFNCDFSRTTYPQKMKGKNMKQNNKLDLIESKIEILKELVLKNKRTSKKIKMNIFDLENLIKKMKGE